jgi:hypothetical protein
LPDPIDKKLFWRREKDDKKYGEFIEALKQFQEGGGKIMTTAQVVLKTRDKSLKELIDIDILDEFEYDAMFTQAVDDDLKKVIGLHEYAMKDEINSLVIPETIKKDCQVLTRLIPPYIARWIDEFCGHQYAPPVRPYEKFIPATVISPKTILTGFDWFRLYNHFRFPWMIDLFYNTLGKIMKPDISLEPAYDYIDAQYWIQDNGEKSRIVVTLVNYVPGRSPTFLHHARKIPRLDEVRVKVNLKNLDFKVASLKRISSDGELSNDQVSFTQEGNQVEFVLKGVSVCEFIILDN